MIIYVYSFSIHITFITGLSYGYLQPTYDLLHTSPAAAAPSWCAPEARLESDTWQGTTSLQRLPGESPTRLGVQWGFPSMGALKMDGFCGEIPFKWMI